MISNSDSLILYMHYITILQYSSFVICGYFAGLISKKSGIIHSIIVGFGIFCIFAIYYLVNFCSLEALSFSSNDYILFLLFISILFPLFGGLIWDLQRFLIKYFRKKAFNNYRLHP